MKKVILTCSHISPRIDVSFGLRKLCNYALAKPELRGRVSLELESLHVDTPPEQAADSLLAGPVDMVGMSTFIWNVRDNLRLAEEIKRRSPDTRVVLGGPQVSDPLWDIFEHSDAVDLVVRGEGEDTFAEVLESWLATGSLSAPDLPGISYRENGGRTVHNPDRALISELDRLPQIYEAFRAAPRVLYGLETTRGCYMRCGYCTMGQIPFRKHSVDYVLEEIEHMAEAGVEILNFLDNSITFSQKRNAPIARRLHDHGIPFVCCAKAEELRPAWIDTLIECGVIKIEFGLQTTRPETLRMMGRKMKLDLFERNVREFLEKASGTEIEVTIDVIAGLPGDDLVAFRDSLDFAYELRPHAVSSFPLQLLPATEFFGRSEELGISRERMDGGLLGEHGRYTLHRFGLVTETRTFPADQIEAARRICLLNGLITQGRLTETVHRILDTEGIRFTRFLDRFSELLPAGMFDDLSAMERQPELRRRVWNVTRDGLEAYARRSSAPAVRSAVRQRFPEMATA